MNSKLKAILAAGIVAGSSDILAAVIVFPFILGAGTPESVLQSVAGGVHGKATFSGGWNTALAGLFIHFCIAFIWAGIFVLLYNNFKKIISNKIILGIIYGCMVWLIMNYVVMPVSAYHHVTKWNWKFSPINLLIIIVCVGLPISLVADAIFEKKN